MCTSRGRRMRHRRRPDSLLQTIGLTGMTAQILGLLGAAGVAGASNLYWDGNGTTGGAGAAPAGTWGPAISGDNFWNDQSDGTDGGGLGTIGPWVAGSTAVFSAGADAVAPFTVSVS